MGLKFRSSILYSLNKLNNLCFDFLLFRSGKKLLTVLNLEFLNRTGCAVRSWQKSPHPRSENIQALLKIVRSYVTVKRRVFV
jgi:hypothetical protein